MRTIALLASALFVVSCATAPQPRTPSSTPDLSGHYLGEGIFKSRSSGLRRPAIRMYMDRAQNENDAYYGVLVEYPNLLKMVPQYAATQKAPVINKLIGYLSEISTHISAYKFVPGQKAGTYEMHNLRVENGQIVPDADFKMTLHLNTANAANPLADAFISGYEDGQINFPAPRELGFRDYLVLTQYELATVVYKKGHLESTWRGNWNDLEGSYLSEYGRLKDGVLELYSVGGQKKMKFLKPNTKAKYFTNPKSGSLEGDFVISEPIPKMYVLTPVDGVQTASTKELTGRIGLFLDVFDASAPEAGSHLVTELAFTNPDDDEDYLMYYEHPEHAKNVGVEPGKRKKK